MHGGRLASIQVLRAIAALAVVCHHLLGKISPSGAYTNIGAAGVDLFFVISGFVMAYTTRDLFGQRSAPRDFLARRAVRIIPLYWLITGIFALHLIVRHGSDLGAEDMSWTSIVASFGFVPWPRPSGGAYPLIFVGWTLNFEMFFYLLFAGSPMLPRRQIGIAALLVALVALVAARSLITAYPLHVLADPIILEFALGATLGAVYCEGFQLPRRLSILLIAAGAILFAIWAALSAAGKEPALDRAIVWGIPAAMILAGSVFSPFRLAGPIWAVALLIGDASYGIYLVHSQVTIFPGLVAARLFHIDPSAFATWPLTYAASLFALSVASGLPVYLWVERPLTQAFKGALIPARASARRIS